MIDYTGSKWFTVTTQAQLEISSMTITMVNKHIHIFRQLLELYAFSYNCARCLKMTVCDSLPNPLLMHAFEEIDLGGIKARFWQIKRLEKLTY